VVSLERKGTPCSCLRSESQDFRLQAGFGRREPETRWRSCGACKLSPSSQHSPLRWRTCPVAWKQQKIYLPFLLFSARGKNHCSPSFRQLQRWTPSWRKALGEGCVRMTLRAAASSRPLHAIRAKPALESLGSPPGLTAKTPWWQPREQFQFPFPPLWSSHRELGGGREAEGDETAAAAQHAETGAAFWRLQHIQTLLKSHLKIQLNQQPASMGTSFQHPDQNTQTGRCECFSSLTTLPCFWYQMKYSLSNSSCKGKEALAEKSGSQAKLKAALQGKALRGIYFP